MNRLKAIIFDVDGTLAETEETHRQSFNLAFERAGLSWNWTIAEYKRLLKITGGRERIQYYQSTLVSDKKPLNNAALLHSEKTRIYNELLSAGTVELRPGVQRLIQESIDSGIKLAIATTTSRQNAITLLKLALGEGAHTWFQSIVCGEDVQQKKPHPEVYQKCLEELNLGSQLTIAIEDSENGLTAARKAGIPVLITPSLYSEEDNFDGAFSVISNLGEPFRSYHWVSGAGQEFGCATLKMLDKCAIQMS